MALSASDILTLVEITRQSRATVQASAEGMDADLESRLSDEIRLWEENRNAVDVELKGEVDLKARRLLDDIRVRVCDLLEYPVPVSGEDAALQGSGAVGVSVRY